MSGPQGPGPGFTIPGSHGPQPEGQHADAYGATQLSAGVPAGATVVGEPIAQATPPPAKKPLPKKGLLIGLVATVVAITGAAFAAYWFWWRASGPELAKYAPKDTVYYLEAPSLPKLFLSLKGVDCLDDKELDLEEMSEEVTDALADSFDLKKDEAKELIESLRSTAVAIKMNPEPEKGDYRSSFTAVLLKVSDAEAIDPLFEGNRFKKDGSFAGGTRYRLSRRKLKASDDRGDRDERTAWQELFDDMGVYRFELPKELEDDKPREKSAEEEEEEAKAKAREDIAVWFEEESLLVYGDPEMVKEIGKVVDGSKESLAKDNEHFAAVKWEPSSTLLEYFDPTAMEEWKKDFFDDVPGATTSMRFDDEGLIGVMRGELRGKKIKDYSDLMPEAVDLDLYEKLPADTFAYMAVATKLKGSGKDWRKALEKTVRGFDEEAAEELTKELEQMEEKAGFNLDTVLDAVGDQMVIAGAGDDKLMNAAIAEEPGEIADNLGVVAIVHLRDAGAAEKIVKSAKQKAEEADEKGKLSFKKIDNGFSLTVTPNKRSSDEEGRGSDDDEVSITVRVEIIEEKYLFVAGGGKKRVDRLREAFDGEGDMLKSDKAHKRALGALEPKSQALVWVDTGRMLRTFLKGKSDAKRMARKKGFPVDALILEGDDRITSGYSTLVTLEDDAVKLEARSLNYPMTFFPAIALFSFKARSKAMDRELQELEKKVEE